MIDIDYSIINQNDSVGKVIALAVVVLFLVLLTFAGRAITRSTGKQNWGIDDALLSVSLLLFIAMSILQIVAATNFSLGAHSPKDPATGQYIPPPGYTEQQKLQFVFNVISVPCNGLTKLAILFFYRRIFVTKSFKTFTNVFIAFIAAWMVAFFFAGIFTCTPVSIRWTFGTEASSECATKLQPYFIALPASDLVTDVMVLALPVPQILQLHMPLKKKLAIIGIFALGFFVVFTGAVRLWCLLAIMSISAEAALGSNPTDFFLINTPVWYWNSIECGTAIVCANLTVLGPLFKGLSIESIVKAAVNGLASLASGSSLHLRRSTKASEEQYNGNGHKDQPYNSQEHSKQSGHSDVMDLNEDIEMHAVAAASKRERAS